MSTRATAAGKAILAIIETKQREIEQLMGTLDLLGVPSPKRRAALPGKLKAAAQRRAARPASGKPRGKAMTQLVLEMLARRPVDFERLFQQLQPHGVNDKRQITGSTASWIRNGLLRQAGRDKQLTVTARGKTLLASLQQNGATANHGDQETAAATD